MDEQRIADGGRRGAVGDVGCQRGEKVPAVAVVVVDDGLYVLLVQVQQGGEVHLAGVIEEEAQNSQLPVIAGRLLQRILGDG